VLLDKLLTFRVIFIMIYSKCYRVEYKELFLGMMPIVRLKDLPVAISLIGAIIMP
jgi:hypothetical protein